MEIIDCKSLMIGDWVMLTDQINNGEKVQVKEIHGDGYITVDGGLTAHVEPIPLSAEILEKNGFAYKEADETCATEAFHIRHLDGSIFAIDDDSWWRSVKDGELHVKFGGFPLKYLHQLQHALRMAEIDKEIKL